jgi:hypothetical protein
MRVLRLKGTSQVTSKSLTSRIQRNSVSSYSVLAYGMSWLGAFAVTAPHWMKGEALPKNVWLNDVPSDAPGAQRRGHGHDRNDSWKRRSA